MPELEISKEHDTSSGVRCVTSLACKRELVIIGAGGFGGIAACVADEINEVAIKHVHAALWDVIGYADCDAAKRGTQRAGLTVHGTIEEVARDFHGHNLWFFCAIGDNGARAKMARLAEEFGWQPATLVHPTAILARTVEIGAGSYIGPASVVSANAKVGAHVIIDMHVSIGHNAVIKDFCATFPGARITGCCRLEQFALVGSNATLLPGTVVGERAVVGANSLAHGSVESDTTILGVPARIIRRRTNSLRKR
jgi:sugar O-acyltransferase (sialic acid O-acetyltransferase NeuD family)